MGLHRLSVARAKEGSYLLIEAHTLALNGSVRHEYHRPLLGYLLSCLRGRAAFNSSVGLMLSLPVWFLLSELRGPGVLSTLEE
jgi:hypothetical protein